MVDDSVALRLRDPLGTHGPLSARRFAASAPARRGARQGSLREHNLALVLAHVVASSRTEPGPSRADLAARTGLTRGAVSALVDQLLAAALLVEGEPEPSQRAGRPAVPLEPARGTVVGLGAEINVDYLGLTARDLYGDVLAERVEHGDYRGSDPRAVLGRLAELVAEVAAELGARSNPPRLVGGGLALPGLVDLRAGVLRSAPNLGWREVDVLGALTSLTAGRLPGSDGRLRWSLVNEAKSAARAEADLSPETFPDFVYVSGEVGIGGAVVLEGEVFVGAHGWGGELGHTTIDPAGPSCQCGSTGCLEQYAGKHALLRAAGIGIEEPVSALAAAAAAGDPAALASLERAGRSLGQALATYVNLVDVDEVVLGGIYGPLAPYLLDAVRAQLATRVLSHPWVPSTVRAARAGDDAARQGAALAALAALVADPTPWLVAPADADAPLVAT